MASARMSVKSALLGGGTVAAFALASCGDGASLSSASCMRAVIVAGRPAIAEELSSRQARRLPPVAGHETVTVPACNDAGQGEPDTTQRLAVVKGIPASVALFELPAEANGRVTFYLPGLPTSTPETGRARRSFPATASNPLHPLLYDSPTEPDTTSGRSCRAFTRSGRIGFLTDDSLTLPGGFIRVQARTRVLTEKLDGIARVKVGQRVTVRAVRCSGQRRPVARSIQAP